MIILEPRRLLPHEQEEIALQMEEWKRDPAHIPIISVPTQQTVESVRSNGGGQGHGDPRHMLMFEPGHE